MLTLLFQTTRDCRRMSRFHAVHLSLAFLSGAILRQRQGALATTTATATRTGKKQNNHFALAAHFLVHLVAAVSRIQLETS